MTAADTIMVRVRSEDGAFWATIDEYPGVFATGDDLDALRESLEEGLGLVLTADGARPREVGLQALRVSPAARRAGELDVTAQLRARSRPRSPRHDDEAPSEPRVVVVTDRRAFFTPKAVATYLAVSECTVRQLVADGTIPSYLIGGSRRIDPDDLDDYLRRSRHVGQRAHVPGPHTGR